MTAAQLQNVSRGTVRQLLFRKYLREANAQGLKDTTRRLIGAGNCELPNGGCFDNLDLESARGAEFGTIIRARYVFESGRVRVVSVLPTVRKGDLFWVKDGRFGARAASSQTLEVIAVRARRVQDMTDDDAEHEGVALIPDKFKRGSAFPRSWFHRLWDDINGRGSWDSNPWVWVYRYRVHALNIDAFLADRQGDEHAEDVPQADDTTEG